MFLASTRGQVPCAGRPRGARTPRRLRVVCSGASVPSKSSASSAGRRDGSPARRANRWTRSGGHSRTPPRRGVPLRAGQRRLADRRCPDWCASFQRTSGAGGACACGPPGRSMLPAFAGWRSSAPQSIVRVHQAPPPSSSAAPVSLADASAPRSSGDAAMLLGDEVRPCVTQGRSEHDVRRRVQRRHLHQVGWCVVDRSVPVRPTDRHLGVPELLVRPILRLRGGVHQLRSQARSLVLERLPNMIRCRMRLEVCPGRGVRRGSTAPAVAELVPDLAVRSCHLSVRAQPGRTRASRSRSGRPQRLVRRSTGRRRPVSVMSAGGEVGQPAHDAQGSSPHCRRRAGTR